MNSNDLKVENIKGSTPLCYAAITGNVNIAKAILQDQNEDLLNPGRGLKPLIVAALFGHKEMVKHLSRLTTTDNWDLTEKVELFVAYASIGMYGKHKFLLFATFTYLNRSFSIN
jgi:ankyrin repeat protein